MQIECEEGYEVFPKRDPELGPIIIECNAETRQWLNTDLYQCRSKINLIKYDL